MEYRFTLSHDAFPDKVISEPQGFEKAELKLLRHEDFHSLIEYYEGEFIFYGSDGIIDGGIDYIREVETIYGHDTDLHITIEVAPDGYTFETLFLGLLKLSELEELPDNKMQVPVIRDDFWSKFINRQETQVNIQSETNLDNDSADQFDSINISLSSQTIRAQASLTNDFSVVFSDMLSTEYGQVDWDNTILDEIEDKYFIPTATNPVLPTWIYEMRYAGYYTFDIQIAFTLGFLDEFSSPSWSGVLTDLMSIKFNEDANIRFSRIDGTVDGDGYSVYSYSGVKYLEAGSIVRIIVDPVNAYIHGIEQSGLVMLGDSDVSATNEVWDGAASLSFTDEWITLGIKNYLQIVGQTTFPATNAESFFIHDVGGHIADRIIGQDQSFFSEVLGSTETVYRQYDSDGCLWNHIEAKGLQIRQYPLLEKPFFQSFKQWWEGVNPIFNLGLGYEMFNNQQVIRVEEKRHFYDETVSINISNVRDIVRKYDEKRLFKAIRIGYKKWQSEDISGIDDPQTKKTYATRLQKSGKDLTIESEFIAASLAIETTRRKTKEKSADYKFDNESFIIAIRPNQIDISPETSPNVQDYEPELDENFTSIENLLNADTRYNLKLTPARNFLRWIDWLSAGLQPYPADPFKFTSGEGNYDMASQIIPIVDGCEEYEEMLSEKQDLEISTDPFHLALLYEIRIPLTWEEYVVIRDNPKNAIGISQTEENHITFFIQELSYTPDQGEALIQAWPVELLSILTIETTATGQLCFTDCGDTYLTEDGFEFETEDENCLILN